PQEIVMPEGDRDFTMWLKNIETLVREMEVPVIVKEVGFGMSRETVAQLASVGVKTIDVSGTGGTDFAKIENARRTFNDYTYLEGWGQSTVTSLVEAMSVSEEVRPSLIASGGIKTPLDIVKSLALGADLVGMSNHFLQYVKDGKGHRFDDGLQAIKTYQWQMAEIMTMLGAKNIADLRKKDLVLAPNVQNWCEARGIDWKAYARRSQLVK
ncbi:alpha-hydroxy-acid oxidizing protein, partial [Streptococcus suis]